MGNNKVRRRDLVTSKLSSTRTTTTVKHDPRLRPQRISIPATANRTLFDTYIQPPIAIAIAMAINIFQLLFGLAIFVYGTLYAVIHKIWTPTVEPYLYTSTNKTRTKNKKTKGKKGKSKPKVAAARKVEIIKSAAPPPPQNLQPAVSPSKSVASVQTLQDVTPQDASATPTMEDIVHASPSPAPATQMPVTRPPPTPASEDSTDIMPVDSVSNQETVSSAEILGIASPRDVDMSPAIPLTETVLLFKLAREDRSEEGILIATGLKRLRKCMKADLRIDPGNLRAPALLALIWGIHFAMAPEFPLPLQNTNATRFLNSREVATVFLNRYGSMLWPDESQPAPHLIDRSLQFERDGTVEPSRYWEWMKMGESHPKKGSLQDLQISKLGIHMTKFVGLVYDLPIKRRAGVDWTAVALVLDDSEIREETLGGRFEGLPGELKRQILRVD